MDHKFLLIIAGWHFRKAFYSDLARVARSYPELRIIISSHKGRHQIATDVLRTIEHFNNCEILFFENVGFDWGMYSKALDYLRGQDQLSRYEYLCFVHDDIQILRDDFLNRFADYTEKNNLMLLGNCRNLQKAYPRDFRISHAHILEWGRLSPWNIKIQSDSWNTVRGSCFFVRSEIFDKISAIPFRSGTVVEFGNWSLVLFGGLVTDNFGLSSIGYYSDHYLESDVILEQERGQPGDALEEASNIGGIIRRLGQVGSTFLSNPLLTLFKTYSRVNERLYYRNSPGLQLNVGRNLLPRNGYLNIAIEDDPQADLVCKLEDLDFQDRSVTKIILRETLGTYDTAGRNRILSKIIRWLRHSGALIIEDRRDQNCNILGLLRGAGFSRVLREFPSQYKGDFSKFFRLVAVK